MDPISGDDPPEVTSAFFTMVRTRLEHRDPAFRRLGSTEEAGRALADLGRHTRTSVWNLQRTITYYSLRDSRALTEAARRRGVDMRFIVSPAGLAMCSIASSDIPRLRVAPVAGVMMIVDSRHVVVSGVDGTSIWTSTDGEVVELAIRAYEAVWEIAQPAVPAGEEPPLTPRMMDIAWLLADGATDRVISRALGISERTVSNEVRAMGRRLGATNRAHTIARICGGPV